MPTLRRSRLAAASPEDLFYMILDVESYPEFIPWCEKLVILNNTNMLGNDKKDSIKRGMHNFSNCIFKAEVTGQFKIFREKYESVIDAKIVTNKDQEKYYFVDVSAVSGPFKHLKTQWKFTHHQDLTKIEFYIDFSLRQTMMEKLFSVFFKGSADRIILLFQRRARELGIIRQK